MVGDVGVVASSSVCSVSVVCCRGDLLLGFAFSTLGGTLRSTRLELGRSIDVGFTIPSSRPRRCIYGL